jgi:hypothetical protein
LPSAKRFAQPAACRVSTGGNFSESRKNPGHDGIAEIGNQTH